jgi:hypothetical protein
MPVEFAYIKDPGATLDYGFDWTDWLGTSETITATSWTVPAGLTKVSESISSYVSVCRISGGAVNASYTVTCQITTNEGEVDRRSILITVQNR